MTNANVQRHFLSPFGKIVATGYYDGPTEGFLVHGTKDALFFFHLLDWDDEQEVRVFAIKSVPSVRLDDVLKMLAHENPPRWPVWAIPAPLSEDAEQFVEHARTIARSVAVGATTNLLGTFDVWQEVPEDFIFSKRDWLGMLGLSRA